MQIVLIIMVLVSLDTHDLGNPSVGLGLCMWWLGVDIEMKTTAVVLRMDPLIDLVMFSHLGLACSRFA